MARKRAIARKRTIDPLFWTDERVNELSIMERLLFIGLWNFSDDAGIQKYNPRSILAKIFPADREITIQDCENALKNIEKAGLIIIYKVDEESYLYIVDWKEQQVINRPKPSLNPFPSLRTVINHGSISDKSHIDHELISDQSVTNHEPVSDMSQQREKKKKKEQKEKEREKERKRPNIYNKTYYLDTKSKNDANNSSQPDIFLQPDLNSESKNISQNESYPQFETIYNEWLLENYGVQISASQRNSEKTKTALADIITALQESDKFTLVLNYIQEQKDKFWFLKNGSLPTLPLISSHIPEIQAAMNGKLTPSSKKARDSCPDFSPGKYKPPPEYKDSPIEPHKYTQEELDELRF